MNEGNMAISNRLQDAFALLQIFFKQASCNLLDPQYAYKAAS
jgi:hypothetical protein